MKLTASIRFFASGLLLASTVVGCTPAASSPGGGRAAPATVPPDDITERLGDQHVPPAQEGASVLQSSGQPTQEVVAAYVTDVVQDADRLWTDFFTRQMNLREPLVSYVVITPEQQPIRSKCPAPGGGPLDIAHDTPNAYYCSADERSPGYLGTIYLPVTTMQKMWTGKVLGNISKRGGDFAAAIVTAHEFGHHVVDELHAQYSERDQVAYGRPAGKWTELIADCMAGVWATHAYHSGYLTAENYEEAVSALEAIGDYQYYAPDHHGTPQERKEALLTGYNGIPNRHAPGAPSACVEKYWKTG
ncbi:neutral zinc metallopeptidase [Streptomyces changanensis]|uniref:Neutral zinc metallopeptidase n=1 Tax=Streptomyces changanensis TaxID=2964669 RepID=A0ABY5MZR7_9ACTN|nr:neutral zinc metallopeptidase [Streptomyces changanensis]UUS29391.1 neutral zinc metallopeptidase [Streptomyces changanensis]